MRILICSERFLFRFGVDRVLLVLGSLWKKDGHEVIMMGNKLDPQAVNKCSDRFIRIPESPDYLNGNENTELYIRKYWDTWFDDDNKPDVVLVAGWPFYHAISFFHERGIGVIAHDYGGVPSEGMNEGQLIVQRKLKELKAENFQYADKIVAISRFIEESQSIPDSCGRPTSHVLLGADHIEMQLWDKKELAMQDSHVVEDLMALKENGYKIIFQPGRWERDNYKNSAESIKIIRGLKERGYTKFKIAILSSFEQMGDIEEDVKDFYFPLGFVDDDTMKKVMELSDVGELPTLWEGFDLPLAEMQFLYRPMFVFNIGAHPEVVSHPYFLCETTEEMLDKIEDTLEGRLPFSDREFVEICDAFKKKFTWQRCADEMLNELASVVKYSPILFIDVTNTSKDSNNSGVIRVTRKLARYLQDEIKVIFVWWERALGQYLILEEKRLDYLCAYGGPERAKIKERKYHNEQITMLEYIHQYKNHPKHLLLIETGEANTIKGIVSFLREHHITSSVIFHDAIPVLRPELTSKEIAENHGTYMEVLSEFDLVMPTVDHNGIHLKEYWKEKGIVPHALVETAALAAEIDGKDRVKEKVNGYPEGMKKILFVSTLEPRKNHLRFLEALEILYTKHPELEAEVEVNFVGKSYITNQEIPDAIEDFHKKHAQVSYLGTVNDEMLQKLYSECLFTAYPSEIEGYGMPIMESLWCGKPCLCSKEGNIGDLAKDGGCEATDVFSPNAMAESLYRLLSDETYYVKLQNESVDRKIVTWREYAKDVKEKIISLDVDFRQYDTWALKEKDKERIKEYIQNEEVTIVVSNNYPPYTIGGAEVVAYEHTKVMANMGKKMVVFTAVPTDEEYAGDVEIKEEDGVLVIRLFIPIEYYMPDLIPFFHEKVNGIFEDICALIKPNIVHCHNLNGLSTGVVHVAKKSGAKVILTLHDTWYLCHKGTAIDHKGNICTDYTNCAKCQPAFTYRDGNISIPMAMRKQYIRRIIEAADAIISPSEFIVNAFKKTGFNGEKMHVIKNGLFVEEFKDAKHKDAEKIRITFVGHFGMHKGVIVLLEALHLLNMSNVEVCLAGSGEEKANYLIYAHEHNLKKQITYLGRVHHDEIKEVYENSDIFVLPSICPENSPVTITEAMACGVPVVASNIGGIPELVKDEESGYLFEAGNAEDLADKLRILIEDKEKRIRMGKKGKEIASNWTYANQVQQVFDIYKETETKKYKDGRKIVAFVGKVIPL
ncbi:MAG: glycosyltransferase, partial [Solobacterium sp.]|nr:glycosyltransferase [Solobacterium sp.]